jgi:hypothetical protein
MGNLLSTQKYLSSEEARLALEELEMMEKSPEYKTESSYSPSSEERLSFVDKHVKYLSTHQSLDYRHYLSNLKLMTKIK